MTFIPPPKNTCDSLSMAGPFPQTLFLGCSIMSFTTSVGWNTTPSTLTVRLVQDPCVGNNKIYWDQNLIQQTTTYSDPGFLGLTYDIIGCPAYFRLGAFEFCGLIQKWEREISSNGNPTFMVELQDPRQLLENSKLILGDYAGTVGGVSNVFNVYGFMESLGSSTAPQMSLDGSKISNGYVQGDLYPDGATFGSPAGAWGGSKRNRSGMPWYNILTGINMLCNKFPKTVNQWSAFGRVTYRGINAGGYGLIPADSNYLLGISILKYSSEYFLDLSELPVPPSYWRFSENTTSILHLITQICADAGYDYYIELVPLYSSLSTTNIAKFIKIRTVKRLSQPALGQIAAFVGSGAGTLSSKQGVELRNETTSCIYIGGPKQTLYQLDNRNNNNTQKHQFEDYILPYFGTSPWDLSTIYPYKEEIPRVYSDGNVGVAAGQNNVNSMEWWFWAETTYLNSRLQMFKYDLNQNCQKTPFAWKDKYKPQPSPEHGGPRMSIILTEFELMASLVSFEVWLATIDMLETDTGIFINSQPGIGKPFFSLSQDFENLQKDPAKNPPLDARTMANNLDKILKFEIEDSRLWQEIKMIYDWVKGFADNLGKKFQVRVPYTAAVIDGDSAQVLTSEEPTSTGWTEQNTVVGLSKGSLYAKFMQSTQDNRYNSMLVLDDSICENINDTAPTIKKDVSALSEQDYIINSDLKRIYIKAQVESEYVYENYATRTGPRAIVHISAPVVIQTESTPVPLRAFFETLNRLLAKTKNIGQDKRKFALTNMTVLLKEGGASSAYMHPLPYNYDTNPCAVCFGIKSNAMVYGPWFTIGPMGGAKVEIDESLVPWEYNGYTLMNTAGQIKATQGLTMMQEGEQGEISLPGYPTVPLGAELGAIAGGAFGAGIQLIENRRHSLGNYQNSQYGYVNSSTANGWTGLYGPNITEISVSVGPQGIQTTYRMKTYTPVFGRFSKANADRLKTIGRFQIGMQRKFMDLVGRQLVLNDIHKRTTKRVTLSQVFGDDIRKSNSPQPYLCGMIKTTPGGMITYAHTFNETEKSNELDKDLYPQKAYMSMEGLLRPVSLGGDGGLPRLAIPLAATLSSTIQAQPPIYSSISNTQPDFLLPILGDHIQPWQNPASFSSNHNLAAMRTDNPTSSIGHDICILGHDSTIPTGSNFPIALTNYSQDYRGLALKGPIFIHGWGYDIDGKPVPNQYDTIIGASGGNFVPSGSNKFLKDFLQHPETWPVAPLDLRFDHQRGVWTTPPAYTNLIGCVISGGGGRNSDGIAMITDGQYIYDSGGNKLIPSFDQATAPIVHFTNRLNKSYPSGTRVILSYNTRTNQTYGEYNVIEADNDIQQNTSSMVNMFTGCLINSGLQPTGGVSLSYLSVGPGLQLWGSTGAPYTGCSCSGANPSGSNPLAVLALSFAVQGYLSGNCSGNSGNTTLYTSNGLSFGSGFSISSGAGCSSPINVALSFGLPPSPNDGSLYFLACSGSNCQLLWIGTGAC